MAGPKLFQPPKHENAAVELTACRRHFHGKEGSNGSDRNRGYEVMDMNVLVTYSPSEEERAVHGEILGPMAEINYLREADEGDRPRLLGEADVIVAMSFSGEEFDRRHVPLLKNVRLIQLIFAGVDRVPFGLIPEGTLVAGNSGAFAKPLAEHVLALTLALAKNLLPKYLLLCEGRFDRESFNTELRDGICGIIGLGGNGAEIARLMGAMGMKIYGINRTGSTDARVDFVGTQAQMKRVLEASDVLIITTPLTKETRNMIGVRELGWMKPDAILINVGRGDVIDQRALYEHLRSNPGFRAGIDTWWEEPAEGENFALDSPFCRLPNFMGSPHNADQVPGSLLRATRPALENVRSFLAGGHVRSLVDRRDYL